jgi:nitrite reductase/ring-hydroxylating ferredoxin subunit
VRGADEVETMSEKTGIPPCMLVAMTRRRALQRAAVAAGAVGLSACFDLPGEFGSLEQITIPPQTFSLDDDGLEALADVGGIAYLRVEEGDQSVELAIVRAGEDELLAFNHLCPHADLGIAPVEGTPPGFEGTWLPDERAIRCGWHKSTFREDGTYVPELSPETSGISNIAVYDITFDRDANTGTITF